MPPAPRLKWLTTPWGIALMVVLALTVVASSVLTVLLVFLNPAPSAQHGPAIVEFTVQKEPREIRLGPDSNLWFTESPTQVGDPQESRIGRISPNGTITEFALPDPKSDPNGLAVGSDGNLWFTVRWGSTSNTAGPWARSKLPGGDFADVCHRAWARLPRSAVVPAGGVGL